MTPTSLRPAGAVRLAAIAVALVIPAPLARAQDEVFYLDHSRKEAKVYGGIESENPRRIAVRPNQGTGTVEIPAADVLDVHYQVPTLHKLELQSAINSEKEAEAEAGPDLRRKKIAVALAKYRDLSRELADERPKRHAEFKIAKLTGLESELDASISPKAIELLAVFQKAHPDSWQLGVCALLQARLELAQGDVAAAQKTYEQLARRRTISPEMALAALVRVVQLDVRTKHYTEAEKRIAELSRGLKLDDVQAQRLQVALMTCRAAQGQVAAAIQALQASIAGIRDPQAKAETCNALGDCYRLAGKPEEARWPYLSVDVLYRQDPDEHARALYGLYKVFQELKDDSRARETRERLQMDARLMGTEYRRRLDAEK
jgi:tetratricopeptide (TPR) repeat protein